MTEITKGKKKREKRGKSKRDKERKSKRNKRISKENKYKARDIKGESERQKNSEK